MIRIRPAEPRDGEWIARLLDERWGGQVQVANGEAYRPAHLPGFVAELDGERAGYAALRVVGEVAWIGLIDAVRERQGVGTALARAVADSARARGCAVLRAITTNDNRGAQAFYEAFGFHLRQVRPGAVNESRKLKPTIPLVADDGSLILDEIEYELPL